MKKTSIILCIALTAIGALFLAGCAQALSPEVAAERQTLVQLSETIPFYKVTTDAALRADTRYGYVIVKTAADYNVAGFEKLGAEIVSERVEGIWKYYYLHVAADELKALQTLSADSKVVYAEPDLLAHQDAGFTLPNDPELIRRQYSPYITHLNDAWATYGFGANTAYVGVIDSGLDGTHEEFVGQIEYMKTWYAADGTTALNTALPALVADPYTQNVDGNGHGTNVTGIATAKGDNAKGGAGVCWQVKILSYKAGGDGGSGSSYDIGTSIIDIADWKVANSITQATIPVNISMGSSSASYYELECITYGLRQGVLVVCSMGNDGYDSVQFPSAFPGVMAIAASNGRDEKVHFSNSGAHCSVAAPGFEIFNTGSDKTTPNVYEWMSGTSQATPFVTGLISYMLTFRPELTPGQVKTIIEDNADDLGATGFDNAFGWGRVNALKTIAAVQAGATLPAARYMSTRVLVTVNNTDAAYDSDPATAGNQSFVPGQQVYIYDAAGLYVSTAITDSTGVAAFNLLKAGDYIVKCNYWGIVLTATLTLDSTADQAKAMNFNVPIYNIMTVPNDAYAASNADSMLYLMDSTGNVLSQVDSGSLDTMSYPLASGQTYYLYILPYTSARTGTVYVGEYGLCVSKTLYSSVNVTDMKGSPATARLATDLVDSMEPNDSAGTAKAITINSQYGLYLEAAGDWFTIAVP